MFKAIDHVQLAAPSGCEAAARRFYNDILGFEEVEKPEVLKKRGGVWFKYGDVQIHIGVEEPFSPARKAHPAFEVLNLAHVKAHLAKHAIDFTNDTLLPGAKRIYVHDPFGNRLEMLEWVTS